MIFLSTFHRSMNFYIKYTINLPSFSTASTQILGLISGVYVATSNKVAVLTTIIPLLSLNTRRKSALCLLIHDFPCLALFSSLLR